MLLVHIELVVDLHEIIVHMPFPVVRTGDEIEAGQLAAKVAAEIIERGVESLTREAFEDGSADYRVRGTEVIKGDDLDRWLRSRDEVPDFRRQRPSQGG